MTAQAGKTQVVVIGAGIVGVCCALALLRRGYRVRLIDRTAPGEGASFGNAGVISPWSFIPLALPGIWKQVPGWLADPKGPLKVDWRDSMQFLPWARRFLSESRNDRYRANADAMARLIAPCVDLYRDYLRGSAGDRLLVDSMLVSLISGEAPTMEAPAWRLRAERGAAIAVIDRNELDDVEPAVGPAYSGAVLVKGQARARSPGQFCKALAEVAANGGAMFSESVVNAISIDADGAPRIELPGERFSADYVVLATGASTLTLLSPLGIRLPMAGERGYHLTFNEPGVSLNNSVLDPRLHFIVSSMTDGIRAAGTSEFTRLERPPNPRRARVLSALTQGMLPRLNTRETRPWMGVRASFPDSLPAIGPLPGMNRVIAAFGQSHWGMSMAPGTGLLVADLISGFPPVQRPKRIPARPILPVRSSRHE